MGWIRSVDRQALHRPHGSLAVHLKYKKNFKHSSSFLVVGFEIFSLSVWNSFDHEEVKPNSADSASVVTVYKGNRFWKEVC